MAYLNRIFKAVRIDDIVKSMCACGFLNLRGCRSYKNHEFDFAAKRIDKSIKFRMFIVSSGNYQRRFCHRLKCFD